MNLEYQMFKVKQDLFFLRRKFNYKSFILKKKKNTLGILNIEESIGNLKLFTAVFVKN